MSFPLRMDDVFQKHLHAHPADHRVRLQFGGVRVDVHTNSTALLDRLWAYYEDFVVRNGTPLILITAIDMPPLHLDVPLKTKPPDPGKTKIKEAYADLTDGRLVRKRLTGMLFGFGGNRNIAMGPCVENDNQVVNFINNRYIEYLLKRGCLLFHSAGVALNRRGLSISGFSGTGKSTLALQMMRLGTDFISNDRVLVKRTSRGVMMHGVAKMPRVNPGTVLHNDSLRPVIPEQERRKFEVLPVDDLWDLEHKYDAFIDQCFGPGKFRLNCPMAGLVVLNWKRGDMSCDVRRVYLNQRRDLLTAFMKSVGLFFEMDDPGGDLDFSEAAYLNLLKDCPVIEVSGGIDFEAAAGICYDFLTSGDLPMP